MIKAKAILEFTLGKFNELKNLERKDPDKNKEGTIYIGDVFECDKEMTRYLLGDNPMERVVIEIVEVYEAKPKKTRKRKTKN